MMMTNWQTFSYENYCTAANCYEYVAMAFKFMAFKRNNNKMIRKTIYQAVFFMKWLAFKAYLNKYVNHIFFYECQSATALAVFQKTSTVSASFFVRILCSSHK